MNPLLQAFLVAAVVVSASACAAKAAPTTTVIVCGTAFTVSAEMPPPESDPVVLMALPCIQQGGQASVIPPAYRQHIQLPVSRPAEGVWVPYGQSTQQAMQEDFKRLWSTDRFDDVNIAVTDYMFPNGVIVSS
jgi:hypothetical protein